MISLRRHACLKIGLAVGIGLAACALASVAAGAQDARRGVAHPALWPAAHSRGLVDPVTEARITRIMARMSLAEKIGQMIQGDIGSITPEDLRRYPLGSVLAGGSSPPLGSPDRSGVGPWLASVRAFNAVATEKRAGHVAIPLMFGIDAVHGHNNVVGATIFPHNSALGAAHDPDLIRRIGAATAEEIAATGMDWAFAPTLAVPQDSRWGRTYEGYSEDPAVVRAYAGPMVEGLQGAPGKATIQDGRVSATPKHFLGDGGTTNGIDQGDNAASEADLIAIHAAGYPPAIDAGARTVMASFSSWQGVKMHGNQSLLTGVLKGRMGFQGFVVGDWNAQAQVPGCTGTDCPAAFNAGLDMAMAADTWKGLFDTTLREARAGTIPIARIDDAVRRILRVKLKSGLFDANRPYEARHGVIGSPAHRALAREAVRETLVLLKNDGVLPLKASAHVLVAGEAADSIAEQSGGWTLSWQGDGNVNGDFPNGQSIYAGIAQALAAGGGSATLSPDGSFAAKPDAAIVVFGEHPYAEGMGDIGTLQYDAADQASLALLRKLKAAGVPVVTVFLSGRPLWTNPEINASNAFVAAGLPGTEGGGVADVLIGDAAGRARHDFTGTLSYAWPATAGQFQHHGGKADPGALFPLRYGLSYAHGGAVPQLSEEPGFAGVTANKTAYFVDGKIPAPFGLLLGDGVTRRKVDSPLRQEGALQLTWQKGVSAKATLDGADIDLSFETNAELMLELTYHVDQAPGGPTSVAMGWGSVDGAGLFAPGGDWRTVHIPLKCFAGHGASMSHLHPVFTVSAAGPFAVSFSAIRLVPQVPGAVCPNALQ